ncbi:MAG: DMT family transporter [Cytophagales bacterium]|nr:DMT family transporter [Cytophagales bacterium]
MKGTSSKNRGAPWILLTMLSLIWGSSFILIKRGLAVFSSSEVGALRVFSAAIFLFPLFLLQMKKLSLHHYKLLFLSGLLGSFFPAFLFAKAQTQLASAITGVLNTLTPIFTLLAGALFFKQKIYKNELVGIFLGFLGATLIIFGDLPIHMGTINYYALWVLLASFCYANNTNLVRHYLQDLTATTIISVSLLPVGVLAGILLFTQTEFIWKLQTVEGANSALGYILLLGFMNSAVAYILFTTLVKLTSSIFASTVSFLVPVVALMWGILDGEVLRWRHYLGIIAILLSVYLVNKRK